VSLDTKHGFYIYAGITWLILFSVRLALFSLTKEIRAGAMRILRYVLSSGEVFQLMVHFKIDFLVARSIDATQTKDIERLQAMRFVRQVLMVCPNLMPHSLIAPLVSVVMSQKEPIDNLTWAALATLSEIALCNSHLISECSLVKALVCGLLKCQIPEISETVILTLTRLLNHPQTRKYIRTHIDIEGLLAPLTDLQFHYLVNDDIDSAHAKSDKEKKIQSAGMSLSALLQSWPGFLLLCSTSGSGISATIHILPLADSHIQKEILQVLYTVFQLKIPECTTDYRVAVASVDPSQYCSDWSLEEGWVAEEGRALLPPKVMERVNLMDCYQALLLASLLELGLFTSLVELVKTSELSISVMAAVLIGELLHIANSILPIEYFSLSLTLPDLVSSAMLSQQQSERNRSSEVINCLDRIHQLKKEFIKPSSLYLKLTLEQTGYLSGRTSNVNLMQSVHVQTVSSHTSISAAIPFYSCNDRNIICFWVIWEIKILI
jgi:rapamycin-insensitive companion of mTOR